MTHMLLALYNEPADPAAFDAHYEQTHSQLALNLPGLRAFTGTKPVPGPDGEAPAYYFVAVLVFDDAQELNDALASPEGQNTVADLANFAGAGVTLLSGPATTYR